MGWENSHDRADTRGSMSKQASSCYSLGWISLILLLNVLILIWQRWHILLLFAFAQTIGKVILSQNEYSISHHVKQKIRSIYEPVMSLQLLLEESPEKANSLEGRIRDVANKAEDIIENFMWEQIHLPERFTVLPANFKVKRQLKKVRGEMDSIVWELKKNQVPKKDVMNLNDPPAASSSSSLARTGRINGMVGLDDDLIAIKSRLCVESPKLQVIPIVGMGGIGKTTLARLAYNDPLTMHHFDICAWVTVSQDYDTEEILSALLISMTLRKKEIDGESSVQSSVGEKVHKSLKGRRYLIVVDDMWSKQAWDDVSIMFPDDGNGSRIILTTRLLDVAAYPDPHSPLHVMRFMDQEHSWDLLRQEVFIHRDCPRELEDIGQEIARNCGGLPLAIVVIAGLLSTAGENPTSWGEIAKSVNSAVAAKEGQFEVMLSLSYTHLPYYLRPCFLYLGIFPEDQVVRVSKLIKLWVAEGFLKRPSGSRSSEEEAAECVEDLVKRNLVLVTKRKSNGKIKSCRLHDLMWDLCRRKAHEEKFLVSIKGDHQTTEKIQGRITSTTSSGLSHLSRIKGSTIRTIMCFHQISVLYSLRSFRLLRILDVGETYFMSLPAQLFELFHLRFLAIYYLGMVPAAISALQNLQTLIIRARNESRLSKVNSRCLPQEIWRMRQLRHLVFYGRLPDPESTTATLENLQTLSVVSHYMCTERILKKIPNLKELEIDCSELHGSETWLNNLVYLRRLENLKLRSGYNGAFFLCNNAFFREDTFTFPGKLKQLTLSRMALPWNEMTVVGSLPNLQVLKLTDHACKGSTWETTEGEFTQLEFLLIEKSDLGHWITESSHFPRLKNLVLDECCRLIEIPDAIGDIPTLELIEVKGQAEKCLLESAKWIQEEQLSYGNDVLQVSCMTY